MFNLSGVKDTRTFFIAALPVSLGYDGSDNLLDPTRGFRLAGRLSPEISMRLVKEHGHSSICRRSVIQNEEYRKLNVVNGQDLGVLYLEVLELPAKGDNYMAYRTVKEFPIVGDVMNKAFEQVATGQLPARDAMNAAQEQAIASLRRAGTAL